MNKIGCVLPTHNPNALNRRRFSHTQLFSPQVSRIILVAFPQEIPYRCGPFRICLLFVQITQQWTNFTIMFLSSYIFLGAIKAHVLSTGRMRFGCCLFRPLIGDIYGMFYDLVDHISTIALCVCGCYKGWAMGVECVYVWRPFDSNIITDYTHTS